jgi:hypothetical protein
LLIFGLSVIGGHAFPASAAFDIPIVVGDDLVSGRHKLLQKMCPKEPLA